MNPKGYESLDWDSLSEFLIALFDPYSKQDEVLKWVDEVVHSLRELNDKIQEEVKSVWGAGSHNESYQSNHLINLVSTWTVEDLLQNFKHLYDYQGGNRMIKIPSKKK